LISTPTRRSDNPSARATFPAQRESGHQARAFVADHLDQWCDDEQTDDADQTAALLVSELVSNAVLHAGTPVEVEIGCSPDTPSSDTPSSDTPSPDTPSSDTPSSYTPATCTIRISVSDGVATGIDTEVASHAVAVGASSGRGLRIIDAFADRWGVSVGPAGKTVWCEIALTAD